MYPSGLPPSAIVKDPSLFIPPLNSVKVGRLMDTLVASWAEGLSLMWAGVGALAGAFASQVRFNTNDGMAMTVTWSVSLITCMSTGVRPLATPWVGRRRCSIARKIIYGRLRWCENPRWRQKPCRVE